MNKIKGNFLAITILIIILTTSIFYFFYVPKPSCTIIPDPSGILSKVCDLGGRQSPYQKILLKTHMYFYPNDSCMIELETGKFKCGTKLPLMLPICNQSATATDCNKISLPQTQAAASSTPMSEWKAFVNTEYGYSILMSQKDSFGSFGGYSSEDMSKKPIVYLIKAGGIGHIAIRAEVISQQTEKEMAEQQKKLFALDLKSYAEAVRNFQLNNIPYLEFGVTEQISQKDLSMVNFPSFPNKKVQELKEIKFAGANAYEFIVEGMRGLFLGPPDGHGGYVLSPDLPQKYIILENLRGQKMIIYYTMNTDTENMVKSIKLTR
ncbi:MAG: hypothetical protein Q7K40_03425 [bacterium]|nr:hypothetical protein [bacterium]